ncbi:MULTISPECIES: rhamnan synthesis F family protein [unclassified Microbacterium]|uniref:rhamnan synthesis F family protein n=1 Tax=unclassified Microbacterium TaxID=2609290 RepID=UPI001EF94BB5|nr:MULTISPECIES: rhamnan synthesis F family protein [unclassified Microbacterium]
MTNLSAESTSRARFPEGGKRIIIYVVFDRRGGVDRYIVHALEALRDNADHIFVVVNGSLSEEGRSSLEPVADTILVRENVGFDIWGYKAALDALGADLEQYDEVLLTNDTWYGPVRSFRDLFDRMDAEAVDFWGLTDHQMEKVNPFTNVGTLPAHIQSYWTVVRRNMFQSDEWKTYWRDLPPMEGYLDAVLKHETIFTERFANAGFAWVSAFPESSYPTKNPTLFNSEMLIEDGCPVVKRRPMFHFPPLLDRNAVIGRWTLEAVERHGYPMPLMLENLAKNVAPRDLNADANLLEVLPEVDVSYDPTRPLRIVVVAHIFYDEMTDEILDRADTLPGAYDLVVTTPDSEKAEAIADIIGRRPREGRHVDIRVLESNDGRDQSAFLVACRDIILSDSYDLLVKLHSKKTVQDGFNIGRHFKTQQFTNLLNSEGYTANLLALFQKEPGLGLVYPPTIHIGYPTMGRGWWSNKPGFAALCDRLGIRVPLDDISPLAPYGSMYIARPEALRLMVANEWTFQDFAGPDAYRDGGLAHILERMPSYAAGELGFHTRTVSTAEYMSISHTAFDFNLDHIAMTIPGWIDEQVLLIRRAGFMGEGRLKNIARMYLAVNRPELAPKLERLIPKVARARHLFWKARHPRTWRRG